MQYENEIKTILVNLKNLLEKNKYLEEKPLEKGPYGDMQYEIDLLADKFILESIREKFGDCNIISEESENQLDNGKKHFIITDPIDGSLNAVKRIPFYSSTILIAEGSKFSDIKAAGTIDLINGDIFIANEKEARLNDEIISPSRKNKVDDALISIDIKIRNSEGKEWLKRLENILATSKSIRTMGSAALETAYVSAGRIDAFISPAMQLRIFDCLPSIFIAKTAGASIRFFEPNLDDINFFKTKKIGYCVAANEDLLEDINNHI